MKYSYDAYCGLYCGACDVMRVNESNKIEEAAKEWDIKPDDVYCGGCKSNVRFISCRECEIRKCAEKLKIEFCFECNEYPCKRLLKFSKMKPHLVSTIENLFFIQEQGLEKWFKKQYERWSCPTCGERFYWYDQTCKHCKEFLNGFRERENIQI